MRIFKIFALGTLVALPLTGILYYWLNPPQCPAHYTQAQIDTSRCIVGANIGGKPVFIFLAVVTWLLSIGLVRWFTKKRR
jgi:hypothetical protein